ncbi:MAG: hypothetical protein Q7U35_08900 [Methanobacteriaceae archaeon]|nr:hypothetical protein [Methanobacteriaceae archaeon]MDP2836637.1 hypothetical protein [Methanobacteriaceae archaeon]MDP3033565.1 hypothetical protein [Methanobacteriaceae archaeon]MDP3485475.1 hypothetical protein [Methanobacteriaceae archaeon]MDP3622413.1 hypothetical protein [Methanobacteriaceae archaeon]
MAETKYCINCGAEIDKKAEIRPKYGVKVMKTPHGRSLPNRPKNQDTSLILSLLIPGLGQIYNEEFEKGILIILGILSTIFILPQLLFYFSLIPFSIIYSLIPFLQIVIYIIIWLLAIYDAYNTAKNTNK